MQIACIDEIRRFRATGCYDMVHAVWPVRHVMMDLFEKALVFVSGDNIEDLISEKNDLSTAHQLANLFLGSLGLPGLDDQRVGVVGFSEETTFYVSMTYFKDDDPFADWVVHEAAHVFHNWKRAYVGLPHTRTSDFLLNIAFAKREVFAYACEAYSRILERSKSPADRRRLYAEYVKHGVPYAHSLGHDGTWPSRRGNTAGSPMNLLHPAVL